VTLGHATALADGGSHQKELTTKLVFRCKPVENAQSLSGKVTIRESSFQEKKPSAKVAVRETTVNRTKPCAVASVATAENTPTEEYNVAVQSTEYKAVKG